MLKSISKYKNSKYYTIITYSIALCCLLILMKYIEYQYFIKDLRLEAYIGIIAIVFVGLGIWVGLKIVSPNKTQEEKPNINYSEFDISKREFEVLELISDGLSNQEIADKLFLSIATIKTHTSRLFKKLEVKRRTEAVAKAKELNIL